MKWTIYFIEKKLYLKLTWYSCSEFNDDWALETILSSPSIEPNGSASHDLGCDKL